MRKKLGIMGVTCNGCDYIEREVKSDNLQSYVNKPCPKCGEIFVTEEDYQATLKFMNIIKFLEMPFFYYCIKMFNYIFRVGRWKMAKIKADDKGNPRFEYVRDFNK